MITPEDIRNVHFTKPPIGQRGYNEAEVDEFLDMIEIELTQLLEQLAHREPQTQEVAVTPPPPPAPVADADPAKVMSILAMAQEMADRFANEARQEAQRVVAEARHQAKVDYLTQLRAFHQNGIAEIERKAPSEQ